MSSLVVFDTTYGHTEMAARAVAEVLARGGPVRTLRAEDVKPGHLEGVTLLVVGTPSHASRPSVAVRAWLAGLEFGQLAGVRVAAFDTRLDDERHRLAAWWARRVGRAADAVAARLEDLGGEPAAATDGYRLERSTGPLLEGETARARAWAEALVTPHDPRGGEHGDAP
jgi:flavodoxin